MSTVRYANLEFRLSGRGDNQYDVEVDYRPLDSEGRLPRTYGLAQLNPDDFKFLKDDEYGRQLTECLFATRETQHVRDAFLLAQRETYAHWQQDTGSEVGNPSGLRVQLLLDDSAERLHSLRWELLCAPPLGDSTKVQEPLSTLDLVPFSRLLTTWSNWRVQLRLKKELRTLVVIASPQFEGDRPDGTRELAEVSVDDEWNRVRTALRGLQEPTLLATHSDAAGPPTRQRLFQQLAINSYDIVYIVCHGRLDDEVPFLLLESTDERPLDDMPGSKLVEVLEGLPRPPILVVLTACQSAGTGRTTANNAHLGLGPRLVKAGVPAVLAMNGEITQRTASAFYELFFTKLQEHGLIDQAMTTARRTLKAERGHSDWWMPVLFMRLQEGRIWYAPEVIQMHDGSDWVKDLISSIGTDEEDYKCIPVIGPELLESYLGPRHELVQRWAREQGLPFHAHNSELPQLAQYLSVTQSTGHVRDTYVPFLTRELLRDERQAKLDEQDRAVLHRLRQQRNGNLLDQIIGVFGHARRKSDESEPYKILASLPLPIYITTNPDSLLIEALFDAGKTPAVDFFPWNQAMLEKRMVEKSFDIEVLSWDDSRDLARLPPIYAREPNYQPTKCRPLVYYLFGHFQKKPSLVLAEDDFFDYLMRIDKVIGKSGEQTSTLPSAIGRAWASNPLLFLGFNVDDWNFRVLFRSILNEERAQRKRNHKSVAVQIAPVEGILKRDEIRQYMEKYFGGMTNIYLGRSEDFLAELWSKWRAEGTK